MDLVSPTMKPSMKVVDLGVVFVDDSFEVDTGTRAIEVWLPSRWMRDLRRRAAAGKGCQGTEERQDRTDCEGRRLWQGNTD
jgi:hypothetical protein